MALEMGSGTKFLLESPTRVFPPRSDGALWVAGKARVINFEEFRYGMDHDSLTCPLMVR